MSGQEEDKKPEDKKPAGDSSARINLNVKDLLGNEVSFRIKREARLEKLMKAYVERQPIEINTFVFMFNGRYIFPYQTPDELEMEDGEEIHAVRRF